MKFWRDSSPTNSRWWSGRRAVRTNNRTSSFNKNSQIGKASWYGKKYHGRKTASGETYDMYKLTAAHRTLKFGTIVKVTNTSNGRSLSVKVNDRGPFVSGRIIDLSYAAAKKLDFINQGVANVLIEY